MSIRINTNVFAINAQRNISNTGMEMGRVFERLSSGLRINRAADDAAGLAISEKLTTQVRGLSQASRNAQDGISLVQVAEGAMTEQHSILQRMRELVIQAGNATVSVSDRGQIQAEIAALQSELTRIGTVTDFNGTKLLDGTLSASVLVGANGSSAENITIALTTVHTAAGLAVSSTAVDVTSTSLTTAAMVTSIDAAIGTVSTSRATFGAIQNRLDYTVRSLGVAVENLSASRSRIRDADIADETSKMVTQQILMQAGTAVLSQANAAPQSVLSLLRG
jgi:flagellin